MFVSLTQMANDETPIKVPPTGHGTAKYSKLKTEMDSPHRTFLQDAMCNPNYRIHPPRKNLTHSQSDTTGILKTVSRQINTELDERQV